MLGGGTPPPYLHHVGRVIDKTCCQSTCRCAAMHEFLHNVFDANRVIILAVYGQVFFVLALGIALHSWRHSRLALARNLQWLAAFGLTHAMYEWGDIFIPFQ